MALSPAFLWQLQSYVNSAGASHFRNFPPLFTHPHTHQTHSWGGEQPDTQTHGDKRVPGFPEMTSVVQTITARQGRRNLESKIYYRVLSMSTALQSFSVWPCSHAALQMVSGPTLSFCPWCWKLPYTKLILHCMTLCNQHKTRNHVPHPAENALELLQTK